MLSIRSFCSSVSTWKVMPFTLKSSVSNGSSCLDVGHAPSCMYMHACAAWTFPFPTAGLISIFLISDNCGSNKLSLSYMPTTMLNASFSLERSADI